MGRGRNRMVLLLITGTVFLSACPWSNIKPKLDKIARDIYISIARIEEKSKTCDQELLDLIERRERLNDKCNNSLGEAKKEACGDRNAYDISIANKESECKGYREELDTAVSDLCKFNQQYVEDMEEGEVKDELGGLLTGCEENPKIKNPFKEDPPKAYTKTEANKIVFMLIKPLVLCVNFHSGKHGIMLDKGTENDLLLLTTYINEPGHERYTILLDGFADAVSYGNNLAASDRRNKELSRMRAENLAKFLTEDPYKINPQRISQDYFGNTFFLVDSASSEMQNRRVEMRITAVHETSGEYQFHEDYHYHFKDGLEKFNRKFYHREGKWFDYQCEGKTVRALEYFSPEYDIFIRENDFKKFRIDLMEDQLLPYYSSTDDRTFLGNQFVIMSKSGECIEVDGMNSSPKSGGTVGVLHQLFTGAFHLFSGR